MRVCGQVKTGVLTTALPLPQNKRSQNKYSINRLTELVFGFIRKCLHFRS